MPRRLRRQPAAITTTHRLIAVAAAVGAALMLAPASALAATGGAGHGHSGLLSTLPLGSIFSITDDLASIAKHLFGAFVQALMPASLTKDGIKLLTWLAALPSDPLGTTYKGVGQLEQDMRDVAVAFIPLTLTLSAARYTMSGLTGGSHHPIQSVVRVVGSGFCLIVWPWFFNNITALINIMTSTIFGFADVHHGLTVLWTTMFGGSAAFGDFTGFAEILIIGAIALVVALIILKVAILVLLAFLFVMGPLAIMLSPIPELAALTKLFGAIFTAAALIPIGWAMMFALGGAFIGSATHMPLSFSGVENGFLALCAGLLCLFATLKWPTFVIGLAKSRLGGVASQVGRVEGTATGAVRGGVASLPGRVAGARSALEAGGRTFARSLGAMGGAMGMPRGGLAGAANRLPGRALNAHRQAGVAKTIKGSASASPAQAWEAMYDHTQRNATFTRPRPGAAIKRGAAVAAATPTAVAASMGMPKAQARVTGAGAASPSGGSGSAAAGASNAGAGAKPRQPDPQFGTAHLDNARARAEVRSPSVRHELDADNARRTAPRNPASPAPSQTTKPTPSPAGSAGSGSGGGSPAPTRSGARQTLSAATPPSPTPKTRGVKGGIQRVRTAAQRATGAHKPLGAAARTKSATPAASPRQGAAPAQASRKAAKEPAPAAPRPVAASPAPSRPNPRSDQ